MDMDQARFTQVTAEIARIAAITGFSADAVSEMANALQAGRGSMAQFSHPELGGAGQWFSGGMLMIGDMFNSQLKARVATLAQEVSLALSKDGFPEQAMDEDSERKSGAWWPETLGQPSSSGAQNGRRYAVFPESSRLAVESNGMVLVYATGEHRIGGVSQGQGETSTLRFTSQLGTVGLDDLIKVDSDMGSERQRDAPESALPDPMGGSTQWLVPSDVRLQTGIEDGVPAYTAKPASGNETVDLIRVLADLRNEGILSEEEFAAKKADLLGRL